MLYAKQESSLNSEYVDVYVLLIFVIYLSTQRFNHVQQQISLEITGLRQ